MAMIPGLIPSVIRVVVADLVQPLGVGRARVDEGGQPKVGQQHHVALLALGDHVGERHALGAGAACEHRGVHDHVVTLDVQHLGRGALLGLAHGGLALEHQRGDLRGRIVEVPRDDGVGGAHHRAGGLEPDVDPMRAVVALGRGAAVRVDVDRVVGQALHPMHACLSNSTMPSSRWYIAVTGQMRTHGGLSQWLQRVTWKLRRTSG